MQRRGASAEGGRTVAGDYQLAGKLGRGGSGVVHKAIHVRKGHIVAVKIISVASVPKDEISSIEKEIEMMRDLKHPNIVKYIDSKLEGSELCIVLEYVEGGSLAKIMHDVGQGTLPATLVSLYLSKMLKGLVYLHSEGAIQPGHLKRFPAPFWSDVGAFQSDDAPFLHRFGPILLSFARFRTRQASSTGTSKRLIS